MYYQWQGGQQNNIIGPTEIQSSSTENDKIQLFLQSKTEAEWESVLEKQKTVWQVKAYKVIKPQSIVRKQEHLLLYVMLILGYALFMCCKL